MATVLRMTLDVEVKEMDEMSESEFEHMIFDTIDKGKKGLLSYVWFMTSDLGTETYEAFEYYIRSDEDAELFMDMFDGNINDLSGNLNRYVDLHVYSDQE